MCYVCCMYGVVVEAVDLRLTSSPLLSPGLRPVSGGLDTHQQADQGPRARYNVITTKLHVQRGDSRGIVNGLQSSL